MYCIAYFACILVAAGLSSAVDVEPRGDIRYDVPGSNLKEAANPSHAHNLPRGYMGDGAGSRSSFSGSGLPDGGKRRRGHLRGRDDVGTRGRGGANVGPPSAGRPSSIQGR